jgi:ferritin-like metal-binding protein YciE
MAEETLKDLLVEQIRDIYDAEKQLVRALPKMAKAAESEELSEALRSHLQETENQVSRLDDVFRHLGVTPKGRPCKGMKGLVEEGSEAIQEEDKGCMRDLAIIAGAQRVEHYEISAYGTARTLAERCELEEVVDLLQETEDEERQADEKLTEVANSIYESYEEVNHGEEEEEGEMAGVGSSSRRGNNSSPSRRRK